MAGCAANEYDFSCPLSLVSPPTQTMSTYTPFNRLIHKIASSTWGARLFSPLLPYGDRAIFRVTNGRHTLTSWLSGLQVIMLTTTGAKTGQPRTVPLVCIPHPSGAGLALIASNWGNKRPPAWYFNLRTNPQATGTIAGITRTYVAHEATAEEYETLWTTAEAIYLGFPRYKERAERHIPIMVLVEKERGGD
jgi:deazaflavin-dependent oxidoreductase (nitroreductase family)